MIMTTQSVLFLMRGMMGPDMADPAGHKSARFSTPTATIIALLVGQIRVLHTDAHLPPLYDSYRHPHPPTLSAASWHGGLQVPRVSLQ